MDAAQQNGPSETEPTTAADQRQTIAAEPTTDLSLSDVISSHLQTTGLQEYASFVSTAGAAKAEVYASFVARVLDRRRALPTAVRFEYFWIPVPGFFATQTEILSRFGLPEWSADADGRFGRVLSEIVRMTAVPETKATRVVMRGCTETFLRAFDSSEKWVLQNVLNPNADEDKTFEISPRGQIFRKSERRGDVRMLLRLNSPAPKRTTEVTFEKSGSALALVSKRKERFDVQHETVLQEGLVLAAVGSAGSADLKLKEKTQLRGSKPSTKLTVLRNKGVMIGSSEVSVEVTSMDVTLPTVDIATALFGTSQKLQQGGGVRGSDLQLAVRSPPFSGDGPGAILNGVSITSDAVLDENAGLYDRPTEPRLTVDEEFATMKADIRLAAAEALKGVVKIDDSTVQRLRKTVQGTHNLVVSLMRNSKVTRNMIPNEVLFCIQLVELMTQVAASGVPLDPESSSEPFVDWVTRCVRDGKPISRSTLTTTKGDTMHMRGQRVFSVLLLDAPSFSGV